MNRKEFIKKSIIAGVGFSVIPVFDIFGHQAYGANCINALNNISKSDQLKINSVLDWLKLKHWDKYLLNVLRIQIQLEPTKTEELTKPLLNISEIKKIKGCEDFAGNKLIEPGKPSMSLLYHLLASPRIKSEIFTSYPSIEILDQLEDYIYSFISIDSFNYINKENVFLAVLAYEYRPAFKTPPFESCKTDINRSAQLVFSRCGIARIGTHPENYDSENRCFSNLPLEERQEKNLAVMPARYALFLVELIDANEMKLEIMNQEKADRKIRHFIQPIKKISNTDSFQIQFAEYHLNEKLKRLASYSYKDDNIQLNEKFDLDAPPFTRINSTLDSGEKTKYHKTDEELVKLNRVGSSVLINSVPRTLVRSAIQNNKQISFKVHDYRGGSHYNRRYGAFKMPNEDGSETTNVVWSDIIFRNNRRTTGLRSPKVSPLFANIKYEHTNEGLHHINGESYKNCAFEEKIEHGGYYAALFEDSICDGCISANIIQNGVIRDNSILLKKPILSAFSLITAPDFFPYIDSNDIRNSYNREDQKINMDQDFFEGGTINLSGIRQRGNPNIFNPFTNSKAFSDSFFEDKSFDTLTAVVGLKNDLRDNPKSADPLYNFNRDYYQTSYLPDTGTGVFFPGWDVTYSGARGNSFLSTFGLGSPFPEDMKLCAAANGMWPVTSPDAGRTFQGSLESIFGKKPNTAIPLMDREIGIHKYSPHVEFYGIEESLGWDGEQGPFIQIAGNKIQINYTDIERADYLQNLYDPKIGFDASILRKLESKEIIQRMDAQRFCVKTIDKKKVWSTQLWLVSALKINNWEEQINVTCLPKNELFDSLDATSRKNTNLKGEGYFFVYARTIKNEENPKGNLMDMNKDSMQKRRVIDCKEIWICQVTRKAMAYIRVKNNKAGDWKTKNYN